MEGAGLQGTHQFHFSKADYYGKHAVYLSPPLPSLFI